MKNIIYICAFTLIGFSNLSHARLTGTIKVCTVHNLTYQEISLNFIGPAGSTAMECNTVLGTMLFNAIYGDTTHNSINKDGTYNVVEPHNPECFDSHIITRF